MFKLKKLPVINEDRHMLTFPTINRESITDFIVVRNLIRMIRDWKIDRTESVSDIILFTFTSYDYIIIRLPLPWLQLTLQ